MKDLLFRSFLGVALLATLFFLPATAEAQSGAKVAALEQELDALRGQVQKLRAEVQDFSAELAAEKSRTKTGANSDRTLQQQLAVERANNAENLRALEARTNAKIKALGEAFNKALAERPASPPPTPHQGNPVKPATIPADMPRNAVKYTIKSGDSLDRIARANKSRVAWILAVNDGLDAKRLKVGREILVPRNAEPDAETPAPAN